MEQTESPAHTESHRDDSLLPALQRTLEMIAGEAPLMRVEVSS